MAERSRPSDRDLAALGRFQGQIERFGNTRGQAINHNMGRNIRVLKVLVALGALRGKDMPQFCAVKKAEKQNFSSTGGEQAAHFLPGQLQIGGRPVWLWAKQSELKRQLEFLFGEVEHLPVAFNQADSEAEANGENWGLCAAFAAAAEEVLRGGTVQRSYEVWHHRCQQALIRAQARKASKPLVPPLVGDRWGEGYTPESIQARSEAEQSERNRTDAVDVLRLYIQDQASRGWNWGAGLSAIREVETWLR
jgi:hypothetical protein